MQRRTFVASLAGLAIAGPVVAQPTPKMGDMNVGDMGTMDRGAHGGIPSALSGALAEGQPLRHLPRLANASATPGVFRGHITAGSAVARFAEGIDTPVLAYNGGTPVIETTEGDHVEIAFQNDIPDEPTTIHWHGMPVPADQDGNPMDAVAPGEARSYVFDLPQGSAASYWFHPHPHELTAEQVYRGLAGVFLVKPANDPIPAEYGDTILMLTDLRLAADGSIPPNTAIDLMNGRVGDHILTNGQKSPTLAMRPGERRRFRLFNATNARFLRIAFRNAEIMLVGSDGGLLERPIATNEILLAPAERVEIVAAFDRPGPAQLVTLDYERGWMGPGKPDDAGLVLLTADVSGESVVMPPLPAALRIITPLADPVITRRFVLSEEMAMNHEMPMGGMDPSQMAMPADTMSMRFLINGASFDMSRIDIVSTVGQVEQWEIVNEADMDHPFHIHGTQFQVIAREIAGVVSAPSHLEWKDTINVVPGETVRILSRQDLPGPRMYHCHILEHEKLGMMGVVDVRA